MLTRAGRLGLLLHIHQIHQILLTSFSDPVRVVSASRAQVLTSANWGGVVGNFFTGGLNLQVEHHLFPAVSFMHCASPRASLYSEPCHYHLQS